MLRYLTPFAATLLAAVALEQAEPAQADQGLRVLLVGHDPEAPQVMFRQLAKPRTFRLYRERTAAWESLLRYHFEHVKVVYGKDYEVAMSDDFDVTIFDARPKELTSAQRQPQYRPASYLPESFDRPAILIAENSPRIGEPIGLKLDWL